MRFSDRLSHKFLLAPAPPQCVNSLEVNNGWHSLTSRDAVQGNTGASHQNEIPLGRSEAGFEFLICA